MPPEPRCPTISYCAIFLPIIGVEKSGGHVTPNVVFFITFDCGVQEVLEWISANKTSRGDQKVCAKAPFNGHSSLSGTLTFNSSVPISVIALRGFTNDWQEFLITTLPVVDLGVPVSMGT